MFVLRYPGQGGQTGVGQSHNLYGGAVSRRTRHPLVPRRRRAAHLVHPRAAVVRVAAEHEACRRVHAYVIVEAVVAHVFVNSGAGVPLAKAEAAKVLRESLVNGVLERFLVEVGGLGVVVGLEVAGKEAHHGSVQDLPSIRAGRTE
jgi:hypothetical protein